MKKFRLDIFRQAMKRVDEKNKINGAESFGITKFSDRTIDEFSVLLGRKGRESKPKISTVREPKAPIGEGIPSYVNWADEGVVTPIKNQVLVFEIPRKMPHPIVFMIHSFSRVNVGAAGPSLLLNKYDLCCQSLHFAFTMELVLIYRLNQPGRLLEMAYGNFHPNKLRRAQQLVMVSPLNKSKIH